MRINLKMLKLDYLREISERMMIQISKHIRKDMGGG